MNIDVFNITDAGKETITDVVGVYDEWLENIESCLSDEEKKLFHNCCIRLLEKAKEISGKSDRSEGI